MGAYITAVYPDESWEAKHPRQSPVEEQAQAQNSHHTEIRVSQQQNLTRPKPFYSYCKIRRPDSSSHSTMRYLWPWARLGISLDINSSPIYKARMASAHPVALNTAVHLTLPGRALPGGLSSSHQPLGALKASR